MQQFGRSHVSHGFSPKQPMNVLFIPCRFGAVSYRIFGKIPEQIPALTYLFAMPVSLAGTITLIASMPTERPLRQERSLTNVQ